MTLGNKKILEVGGGSSGSPSLEKVWKRLWTCYKTDYYLILKMSELKYEPFLKTQSKEAICNLFLMELYYTNMCRLITTWFRFVTHNGAVRTCNN
jgi:hypothetical protein